MPSSRPLTAKIYILEVASVFEILDLPRETGLQMQYSALIWKLR